MTSVANMASVMARPLLLSLLTITTAFGCAVGPAALSTRTFDVTGFTLPVQMVFSMAPGAAAQVPGIAPTAEAASGFVKRIVMQAVLEVLEQQGRAAGLSDPIIQVILDQLTVNIMYQPLRCDTVSVNPGAAQS
ncbi:unnamed protein product [Angiostrongylus costaricensis]|uniref:Lipoprotein n=1 Tax=Angiostrongylus costaricensis TaxID=334426 RepID=A0A0R3PM35_ANGCS|nr:unnamed protein product [Angiostrongylus costaricensis]